MASGQWTVDSGQWPVASGQFQKQTGSFSHCPTAYTGQYPLAFCCPLSTAFATLKPHRLNSFATLKRNSRIAYSRLFPFGMGFFQLV